MLFCVILGRRSGILLITQLILDQILYLILSFVYIHFLYIVVNMARPRSHAYNNGITYSSTHQTLLVGSLDKILVRHPENGFHLQTIHLDGFGSVWDMAIHGSQLILHHVHESQHKISYLQIL